MHVIANTSPTLLLIPIILLSFVLAHGQSQTCALKSDQLKSPSELYGLHLGMTLEEVKKVLPLAQFGRADRLGVMRTSFNPHFDQRVEKSAFPDVRTISMDFLDGKLTTIWIGY